MCADARGGKVPRSAWCSQGLMYTMRGLGSRTAGALGRWGTLLHGASSDEPKRNRWYFYSRCRPTGLTFLQQHEGIQCYTRQRSQTIAMHGMGVPFGEAEHCDLQLTSAAEIALKYPGELRK